MNRETERNLWHAWAESCRDHSYLAPDRCAFLRPRSRFAGELAIVLVGSCGLLSVVLMAWGC
jgi:hypothetical protein